MVLTLLGLLASKEAVFVSPETMMYLLRKSMVALSKYNA